MCHYSTYTLKFVFVGGSLESSSLAIEARLWSSGLPVFCTKRFGSKVLKCLKTNEYSDDERRVFAKNVFVIREK